MITSLVLPKPDMPAFNRSRTLLRQQALSLGDIYLPRLQEKLRSLLIELDLVDTQALSTLTTTPTGLETDGLPELIKTINELRDTSPEDEAVTALIRELKEDVQRRISHVADHVGAVDDAMRHFKGITLDDAGPVIGKLEAEILPEKTRLEEERKPLADLQAQETAVNKLIAEIESISLLERLKPLVESLDKLLEIDPKDPLVGSIKAGLEGIKHLLDLGIESAKYEHLISLRQKLQERLESLKRRLRELGERIAEQEGKIAQLKTFEGLGPHQHVYLRELDSIIQAIKGFAKQNQIDDRGDVVEQVGRFIENAAAMTTFLHGLRRAWQS